MQHADNILDLKNNIKVSASVASKDGHSLNQTIFIRDEVDVLFCFLQIFGLNLCNHLRIFFLTVFSVHSLVHVIVTESDSMESKQCHQSTVSI